MLGFSIHRNVTWYWEEASLVNYFLWVLAKVSWCQRLMPISYRPTGCASSGGHTKGWLAGHGRRACSCSEAHPAVVYLGLDQLHGDHGNWGYGYGQQKTRSSAASHWFICTHCCILLMRSCICYVHVLLRGSQRVPCQLSLHVFTCAYVHTYVHTHCIILYCIVLYLCLLLVIAGRTQLCMRIQYMGIKGYKRTIRTISDRHTYIHIFMCAHCTQVHACMHACTFVQRSAIGRFFKDGT